MPDSTAQLQIRNMRRTIASQEKLIQFLEENEAFFEQEGFDYGAFTICENAYLNFNALSHEASLKVIKVTGARFEKSYNDESITYKANRDGFIVQIYCGKPPEACKIVEEEVEVPEQVVPAHKVIRKKIVCPEWGKAAA